MKKYVALLRGINVGGNNKVDMGELKVVFEKMGFFDVSTYINSGNVLFSSKAEPSAEKIEKVIEKKFGFPVRTLVRDTEMLKEIVSSTPIDWSNDKDQKTDVLFLWDGYDTKKSIGLIKTNDKVDTLVYVKKSIVWHIHKKDYNKSGMNKFIGTEVYKNMTARNINTVRKLVELSKTHPK